MDDFSHLKKAHKDDEKETLLHGEHSHSATDGKECLEQMKFISDLIAKVNLLPGVGSFNLLLYRAPLPS